MSFKLPANNLSQADLEASNKTPVYVATAVGFALATGSVILRVIARRKSKANLGWDDYSIVFAIVSLFHLVEPISLPLSDPPTVVSTEALILRTTLDSSLCAGHRYSSVCGKVWAGPTSARCPFHYDTLSESKCLLPNGCPATRLTRPRRPSPIFPCG